MVPTLRCSQTPKPVLSSHSTREFAKRWACRNVAGLSLGSINFLLVFLQVACAHISEQGRLVRQRFLESSQGLRAETEMFAHLRRSLIDGA